MSQNKLKRRLKKFAICSKNSTGKVSAKTGGWPDAELMSAKEIMRLALKDVYGLSDAQCAEFFRRAHEDGRL